MEEGAAGVPVHRAFSAASTISLDETPRTECTKHEPHTLSENGAIE